MNYGQFSLIMIVLTIAFIVGRVTAPTAKYVNEKCPQGIIYYRCEEKN